MKSGVGSIHTSKEKLLIIESIEEKSKIEVIDFDNKGTNNDEIIKPITYTIHVLANYSNSRKLKDF